MFGLLWSSFGPSRVVPHPAWNEGLRAGQCPWSYTEEKYHSVAFKRRVDENRPGPALPGQGGVSCSATPEFPAHACF